jgi:hypothetical protein
VPEDTDIGGLVGEIFLYCWVEISRSCQSWQNKCRWSTAQF